MDGRGEKTGVNGIYEHECENTLVWDNCIYDCDGEGVKFQFTPPEVRRFLGENRRVAMSCKNRAEGNLICGCSHGIMLSTVLESCNRNLILNARISECMLLDHGEHHNRASFRELYGFEANDSSVQSAALTEDELILKMKNGAEHRIALAPLAENKISGQINSFTEIGGSLA